MDTSKAGTNAIWPYAATLVLAADTPRQRRWAVATAIGIVRKLATERPKVVLADLQTRRPSSLAAALGVEEGPGIVDVLFRGASFSASAHRPESESFFFLTVGSDPPPGHILYQHPRWKKIAARLKETNAHLLPCVSAGDWLDAGPIPGFEASIVLNAVGLEVELPAGARRLAEFLAPPDVRAGDGGTLDLPSYASSERGIPPLSEEPVAESGAGERPDPAFASGPPPAVGEAETTPAGEAESDTLPAGLIAPESPWRPGRPGRRLRRGPPGRLVAGVIVAAAVVAAVALWKTGGSRQIPEGAAPLQAAAEVGPPDTAAAEVRPEVVRHEVELPFSVAIASFSSFDDAVARQREWTQADVPFYVAPTVVRGVVYYRVFAGMLPEREQAVQLMNELVSAGLKDTVRNWDVRPAGLAFSFGAYPDSRAARGVLETLMGRGVPAYIVPAIGAGGEVAYHVYAGGYENSEDARPLREVIERAGLDAELVERVGLVQQ